MPEGDTVWLAALRMDQALAGRPLTTSDFRVPALATADLTGRVVTEVRAVGKHMWTRVEGGLSLHSHFRMDGTWRLHKPGQRWSGGPAHQVRLVLANADWVAVGYRLHDLKIVKTADEDQVTGHLGPDLLGPDWGPTAAAEAVRRLEEAPDRAIGEAVLDQRNLAGIGNLYKAETLFVRGVNPWTPVREVDLPAIVETGRQLLRANRDHPEQTTTGSMRRGEQHFVFERARKPCLRCRTPVAIAEQGPPPQQRLTYWCPRCQPGPVDPAAPRPSSQRQARQGRTR